MTRGQVIKGLECCLDINGSKYKHCLNCDYRHDIDHCQWACQTDGILEDALALLKAQDAELERLKNCRAECKIDCLLKEYNTLKEKYDGLMKAQEPIEARLHLCEWKEWLDERIGEN